MPTVRLTCATVLLSLALCATAAAVPRDARHIDARSGLKGSVSQTDLRSLDAPYAALQRRIALATERYYSSYGSPEPIRAQTTPPPVQDDGTPWFVFAIVGAAALALGTQLHRLRPRRRRPALS